MAPLTNWLVFERTTQPNRRSMSGSSQGDLEFIASAFTASAERALEEVARNNDLGPGKYAIISLDFTVIATGTVTHRVVMD